jgi:3-oxoacyl-[acyl-carrier protein] reductase
MLTGKRIAITGASRGLGRAIALVCARHGADIAVGYCRSSDAAQQVVAQITALGRRALPFAIELADPKSIDAAVATAWDGLGALDGWVNNAAAGQNALLVGSDPAAVEKLLAVNLAGPILCARAVVERMLRNKSGVVLNISSVAAVRPSRGMAAYAAAKGGIESFTRALAVEYAKKGLRAVGLRPGAVDTDMLAPTRAVAENEILARIPQGRIASPDEIAGVAAFLLSDRAAYITGETLGADGGFAVA